ncbi:MAG: OmpA family protein [Planctomycetota bacterium]
MIPTDTAQLTQPRRRRGRRAALLLALVAAPALSSCVSEAQMRLAVEERDREISALRSDKVQLQERLDLLNFEKEDLRSQLAAAQSSAKASTVPTSYEVDDAPLVPFPELQDLGIDVSRRKGDVVISVPTEITFGSGKATLSDNGRSALGTVAARLKSEFDSGSKFYIEGHTDSDPIRKSSFASNRDLSIARAMAVLQYLVTEARIPDRRFVVVGHGQYAPVAPNDGDQKAKNRRVEIVVKKSS